MGETQENCILVSHQNGQNPHCKYHLQLKTKEEFGGQWFGTSEGRKIIQSEMEKQIFGK